MSLFCIIVAAIVFASLLSPLAYFALMLIVGAYSSWKEDREARRLENVSRAAPSPAAQPPPQPAAQPPPQPAAAPHPDVMRPALAARKTGTDDAKAADARLALCLALRGGKGRTPAESGPQNLTPRLGGWSAFGWMVLGGLLTLILVFLALVSLLAYYNQPAPAAPETTPTGEIGRILDATQAPRTLLDAAFEEQPKVAMPPAEKPAAAADQKNYFWTCSMHPEVKTDKPGNCPKCGMTLAPVGEAATAPTPVTQKLCPVTGDPIDPKIHVDYNRRRIYFCCEMCPPIFRKDPEKYLKKLDEQMGMKTQAADDAKPAAANPPLEPSHAGKGAHVTAVDNDAKTASIDLGSEDGVAEGMAFMIYNAAEKRYLATLTIKIVSKKSAAGDLSVIRGAIKVNYSAARIPNS